MRCVFKPLGSNILVKLYPPEKKTDSGIVIVKKGEQWQEQTVLAEIVAVNKDFRDAEVGQVIIMRGDAGRWIDPSLVEDDEHVYRMVDQSDLFAVVTSDPVAGSVMSEVL